MDPGSTLSLRPDPKSSYSLPPEPGSRLAKVDPDLALRRACQRFEQRFRFLEETLGDELESAALERMEEVWQEAKRREAAG